jgi:GAF domain-containing protein
MKPDLRRQNQILMKLARSPSLGSGDLDAALKEILEAAAQTLETERANVWLYNEERSKIQCFDHYERSTGRHTKGAEISAADYPAYFKALEQERTIAAYEANTDPRTRELSESYLRPYGISSLLDAPILLNGQMVGIICHEHVGSPRQWSPEEQSFAGSMADFVSLALESGKRRQAEESLKRYTGRLQILHELDRRILVAEPLHDIAQAALTGIRQLVPWQRAGVTLFDFRANEMWVLALDSESETELKVGTRLSLEPYQRLVARLRQGEVIEMPVEAMPVTEISEILWAEGIRFGTILPLMVKTELSGSVNLWRANLDSFPPEHLSIAREIADQLAIAIQQAHLLDETQRRVKELAGLYEIAQAFGSLTDVKETFGSVAERLAHLVGARICLVFLLDPAGGEMQAQAPGYGVSEALVESLRYSAQFGRQIWDLRERGSLLANGPAQIPAGFYNLFEAVAPQSLLVTPMWLEGYIVGQVTVCNKPGGFSQDDARLLQVFANQAVIVIQNARLFEAEAQRWQETEALRDIAAALNSTLNLEEVLDRILANVGRVVPHDAANIMLIEAGVARIVRSRGYAEHGLEEMVQIMRFPIADMPERKRMIESGQPLVILDTQVEPTWIIDRVRSHVSAPIRLKTEVVGFLNLDSFRPRFFTSRHAERLQTFADQAAVAIQNARLYAKSEQDSERLRVLHEIDQAILAAQSPQAIAQIALQRLRQLIPCQRSSLMLFDFETDEAIMFAVNVNDDLSIGVGERFPLPVISSLKVLEQGQYFMIEDIAALTKRSLLQQKRLSEEGIRSYINLPLISRGELIGSLNLGAISPGAWSPQQIEMAGEVASQVAIAIQQARLQEQVEHYMKELEERVADRTRELSALYDVTSLAGEALKLKAILERSLERAVEAMRGQVGVIHLLDETRESLSPVAYYGFPPEEMVKSGSRPAGVGLAGWIVEHGEPLIATDVATDPRVFRRPNLNLEAYAGAPVRARGQVLGVLNVAREKGQPQFNLEEVALLTSIADHIGVVVESARLRRQAEQTAVIEERARLARDLHDSVTQLLYSVNLFASVGREAYRQGDMVHVNNCLAELSEIAQQALKEMRLLVYELRPSALEHDGLARALQQRLDAVEGRAGVKARLVVGDLLDLPGSVETGLYHIAQEALNNALKHARAAAITVQLQMEEGQLELKVADNGSGFDLDAVNGHGGLGLVSMRERAEKLGGELNVLSKPGEGTTVKVTIPITFPETGG